MPVKLGHVSGGITGLQSPCRPAFGLGYVALCFWLTATLSVQLHPVVLSNTIELKRTAPNGIPDVVFKALKLRQRIQA